MFIKLLALFLLIPIIELFVMFKIGKIIGPGITILIIIITAFIGAKLTKVQGTQAIRNGQAAIKSGKLPHKEVMDGVMIIIAGALLLTPGFLTDIVGFSLLLPGLRSNYRKLLLTYIKAKILFRYVGVNSPKKKTHNETGPSIIEAEIIDDD